MKRFFNNWIVLLLLGTGLPVFFPVPAAAWTSVWSPRPLADLIEEGISNNLDLKSRAARVESLKHEAVAAGAPDDPMIGFGLLNLPVDTFSFKQEPMTQKQIFIRQKIPWPGKLSLRSRKVLFSALKEEAGLNAQRLRLSKKIAETYYDWAFTNRNLEINRQMAELVRRLLDVSETRYAVGKGLQQDVLQAQVELSQLLDENIMLQQKRTTLENDLHRLLNRENFSQIPMMERNIMPDPILDSDRLTSMALENNPTLLVLDAGIRMAETEVELARRNFYPDFDVRLAYGQRDEDRMGNDLTDFASATVAMNIPIWKHKKQDSKLAAARKRLESAVSSYNALAKRLPFEIDSQAKQIESTKENYRLFRGGLLVQARQWAQSAQSAYSVNKIEFNTMISTHIRLLRFQLRQETYLFNLYKQIALLEETVGVPIMKEPAYGNKEKTP